MASIDDITPTQYGGGDYGLGGGGEGPSLTGGGEGPTMTDGGGGMNGGGSHDLIASGEITISFGWDYDPTSN